jgi:hypothetical protein
MTHPDSEFEYDLFISYSRRDVVRPVGFRPFDVVAELKRCLEEHRHAPEYRGRSRRFRVCTDLDDFEIDGTFDSVMQSRIASSRALLLVCTPSVATSPHVRHELAIARGLPHIRPMAAVLSAAPASVAQEFFSSDDIAADLATPAGTTRKEWRRLLRRESHKIVARTWQLKLRDVHDRFEADRRTMRRRILGAGLAVVLFAISLVLGLAGEAGFHRVAVLTQSTGVVAPAGVAFASDGRTPVVISNHNALMWSNGLDQPPVPLPLPFDVLHTTSPAVGELAIVGLHEIARITIPALTTTHRTRVGESLEAVAALGNTLIVSTQGGALLEIDSHGNTTELPRPISVSGRRFPAFRESGPLKYGELIEAGAGRFVASATLTGHLAILDMQSKRFVNAEEPQFPLAPPIESRSDPVLYETENTRPIGAISFLPDRSLMFGEGTGLRRVDTASGRIVSLTHCPLELVRQLLVMPDGRTIVALTSSTLEVLQYSDRWDRGLECRQRATLAPKSAPRAVMAADGKTLLIAFFDGAPELWRRTYRLFGLDFLDL